MLQDPQEGADSAPYAPTAVAVIATPWVDPQDGVSQPEMAWPGPALPGEPTGGCRTPPASRQPETRHRPC